MKILKFILLSVLISTTLNSVVVAQLTETKESTCNERIPALQIYSVKGDSVEFNESDFEGLEVIELLSRLINDNGPWVNVPFKIRGSGYKTDMFKACGEYSFKAKILCGGKFIFTASTTFKNNDKSCIQLLIDINIQTK